MKKANLLSGIALIILFFVLGSSASAQYAPNFLFAKKLYGAKGDIQHMAKAPGNDVYTIGSIKGTQTFGGNTYTYPSNSWPMFGFVLTRIDSLGNVVWSKPLFGNPITLIWDMKSDTQGNIYIIYFTPSIPDTVSIDGISTNNWSSTGFAKFDQNGNCIWINNNLAGPITFRSIDVDGNGNLVLAGDFTQTTTTTAIPILNGDTLIDSLLHSGGLIAKFDNNGNHLWHRILPGDSTTYSGTYVRGYNVTIDSNDNILFVANFNHQFYFDTLFYTQTGGVNSSNSALVKLDPSGNLVWGQEYPTGMKIADMVADSYGNVLVTGECNNVNFQGVSFPIGYFFIKMADNGNPIWIKSIENNLSYSEYYSYAATHAVADQNGNFYVTGSGNGDFVFNGQTYVGSYPAGLPWNGFDIFLLKINQLGQFDWVKRYKNKGIVANGVDLTIDDSNNFYLAAEFADTMALGNTILISESPLYYYDYYITRIKNPESYQDSYLNGKVYFESNGNCLLDSSETRIQGTIVKVTPGNYYAISNAQGLYQYNLPIDTLNNNYQIKTIPPYNYSYPRTVICPANNTIDFTMGPNTSAITDLNFGLEPDSCIRLALNIAGSGYTWCCRDHTWLNCINYGIPVSNAYVILQYPSYVIPQSCSLPMMAINDSTYRVNLPQLNTGETVWFYTTDSISCVGGLLGLSQCIKATIYPSTDCVYSNWIGAQLNASGNCSNGSVFLSIFNDGVANMSDSTSYTVYLDSIQVQTGNVMLNVGDTLQLQVLANGQSVHLHVNQVADHPFQQFVTVTQDACNVNGNPIPNSFVNTFPKSEPPYSKSHCGEIISACDPNDKSVTPIGVTTNHIVPPDTRLEYLIRFQNTGNDTAFVVMILDTLSSLLNPESIEIGVTSHPNQFSLQNTADGKVVLKWLFNNINLPDSTTDLFGSSGLIQFYISPKDSLPLGSQVFNEAAIYFDYNAAVITNQTLTTFGNITFTDTSLNESVFIVPNAPVLITPADNAVGVPNNTDFDWTAQQHTNWYKLEYDTDVNFSNTQSDTCVLNQYSNSNTLADNTTYYWRVKAYNNNQVSSVWSHVNIFTTDMSTALKGNLNNQITVFPNPSNNGIFIVAKENNILQIEITDLSGRVVFNEQIKNQGQIYLPLNLNKGFYHLKVATENNTSITKLIIE